MDKGEEFFCYVPPVDIGKKYTYAVVYARYPKQKDYVMAVGIFAICDEREDYFIIQFFQDQDIKDFFQEKVIDHHESFSEEWLVQKSCEDPDGEFFFGMPYVVEGDSAKKICRRVHDTYEEEGYILKDSHEKWL